MRIGKFISFIAFLALVFFNLVTGPGCANIVPPEGGPRDSLPPVLRSVNPRDSSRNFKGNRINFTFDEYIDLDNPQSNLIVSPLPKSAPTVTRKLNSLSVKLRDTLEANTTYTLNFGNSIVDVNEKNVARQFTYVFSTGNVIDSLRISGRVVLAESGETDTTLTVMLHRSGDDSILLKEKPRYVAKLDGKGNFIFRNLPSGTFYLYALADQGGQYRYQTKDQLFAFADSAIVTQRNNPSITLYAYASEDKIKKSQATLSARDKKDKRLRLTNSIVDNRQDLLKNFTITSLIPLKSFDSTKLLLATDSTFTPVTGYAWRLDSTRKILTLDYSWKENTLYHVLLAKDFATDTLNEQLLKADTLSFTTRANDDYGRLRLRFRNLDLTRNPVLQLVQNGVVTASYPLVTAGLNQSLIPPAEYTLRILWDTNKNGVWDPGEFFGKHRQPELVKTLERKINVRPGYDNEFEVDINALPAPPKNPAAPNTPRSLNTRNANMSPLNQ